MSTVEQNITARQEAEAIMNLCGEQPPRFWEVLAGLVATKLPLAPTKFDPFAPMDEQEAIRFEATIISFGAFQGQQIGVVEARYIGWLAENEFAINLRRYVKSERFQRRQREEE